MSILKLLRVQRLVVNKAIGINKSYIYINLIPIINKYKRSILSVYNFILIHIHNIYI